MISKTVKRCCTVIVFICLLTGVLFAQSAKPTNNKEFVFAAFPFESTLFIAKLFSPLITHLEKSCGIKMRFVTAPSWDIFMERLLKGKYDIVYGNPYHYIIAHKLFRYKLIAKISGEPPTGILLVNKKSNIKTVKDLIGKTIAFPHRDAWSAYWLVKDYLLQNGIDIEQQCNLVFLESHKASVIAAYNGFTDASGTWSQSNSIHKEMKESLTILFKTAPHPNIPIFVNPDIDKSITAKIKTALLTLHESNEGREILNNLMHEKFVEANDSDYNITRKMCTKLGCWE